MGLALNMARLTHYENKIPYPFVLDYLTGVELVIKPMFGCYGIYSNGKLCLFLVHREKPLVRREKEPMQKGVYVATTTAHSPHLKAEFPKAEFEQLKGEKVWVFISDTLDNFEQYVVRACELISSNDERIGRSGDERIGRSG